jgi:hypothetical protein
LGDSCPFLHVSDSTINNDDANDAASKNHESVAKPKVGASDTKKPRSSNGRGPSDATKSKNTVVDKATTANVATTTSTTTSTSAATTVDSKASSPTSANAKSSLNPEAPSFDPSAFFSSSSTSTGEQNELAASKQSSTKRCKFWGKGKGCKLGDTCSFLHDHVDQNGVSTNEQSGEGDTKYSAGKKKGENNDKGKGKAGKPANVAPQKKEDQHKQPQQVSQERLDAVDLDEDEFDEDGRKRSNGKISKEKRKELADKARREAWFARVAKAPPLLKEAKKPQRGQKKPPKPEKEKSKEVEEPVVSERKKPKKSEKKSLADFKPSPSSSVNSSQTNLLENPNAATPSSVTATNVSSVSTTASLPHVSIPSASRPIPLNAARPPVVRPVRKAAPNDTPLTIELRALERRFRPTFYNIVSSASLPSASLAQSPPPKTSSISGTVPSTVVEFGLAPSDPDFPFDLETLHVRLIIPDSYPAPSTTSIKVINPEIPAQLRRQVERGWSRKVDGLVALSASRGTSGLSESLLDLVNWLDRNLERLLTEEESVGMTFVSNVQNSETAAGSNAGSNRPDGAYGALNGSVAVGSTVAGRIDIGPNGATLVARERIEGDRDGFKDRVFYYGVPRDPSRRSEPSTASDFDQDGFSDDSSDFDDDDDVEEDMEEIDVVGDDGEDGDAESSLEYQPQQSSDSNEMNGEMFDPASISDSVRADMNAIYGSVIPDLSKASSSTSIQPLHKGTQIRLPDLFINRISLVRCISPSFIIRCARCKGSNDVTRLTPNQESWVNCDTCGLQLGIQYRPSLLHSRDSTKGLGYLDLQACTIVDLLPSVWELTCEECGEVTGGAPHGGFGGSGVLKSLPRGVEIGTACFKCHTRMAIMGE